MNISAFITRRQDQWQQLRELSSRRHLSAEEAEQLVDRYRATGTDLSTVSSQMPDRAVISHLSALLIKARGRVSSPVTRAQSGWGYFFAYALPAAWYRLRWWTLWVTIGFFAVAFVTGWVVVSDTAARDHVMPPELAASYVNHEFREYYGGGTHWQFGGHVWFNNAWIALQCVGGGVTGLIPLYVLFQNAVAVGGIGGAMTSYGEAAQFWSLITPHGMLEIYSILVAGAAGLRLCWAWMAPGNQPRVRSLATEGRALATVAVGLVITLFVSGLVEGFVTGRDWPTAVRVSIGALAFAGCFFYLHVMGASAVAAGQHGDVAEDAQGAELRFNA